LIDRRLDAAGQGTGLTRLLLAAALGVFVVVFMIFADLDALQDAQRVMRKHGRRAIERD
jgi:hypothetical protein